MSSSSPQGVATDATAAAPDKPRSGMRALIVEDETALAGWLVSYFDRDGFDASFTGDRLRAVEIARDVAPDVVVLDLGLPGLDGVEVFRTLRTVDEA